MLCWILVAQNRKCSIDPAPTPSFLGYPYTLTCYAKARTIILAWKSGVQNQSVTSNSDTLPSNTFNISSLGVSSTPESVRQLQTDGYDTSYKSLRKSTMTISKVSMESARPYYCFVFDLAASAMLFCQWSLVINRKKSFVILRVHIEHRCILLITYSNCNAQDMRTETRVTLAHWWGGWEKPNNDGW